LCNEIKSSKQNRHQTTRRWQFGELVQLVPHMCALSQGMTREEMIERSQEFVSQLATKKNKSVQQNVIQSGPSGLIVGQRFGGTIHCFMNVSKQQFSEPRNHERV
jgi:hypothetical protein